MSAGDERHPGERLSALLDGELAPEERADVEAHLEGCAECRSLLTGIRAVARAAAGEEPPAVPRGLEGRIAWRLRSASGAEVRSPARPWWRARVPLTAAATLAAFGLVAGIWWREHGRPEASAVPAPSGPAAPAARIAAPVQEKGKDAVEAAPPAGEAGRPAAAPAATAPAPVETREKKFAPAPAAAPPPPAKAEASARREEAEHEPGGGRRVVGGVVGGIVGGVVSGEAAGDLATAEPAPRSSRLEAAAVEAPSAAPPTAGSRFRNVSNASGAACPSAWTASPPEGWTLHGADPRAAGDDLVRLASGLGGNAVPVRNPPGTWRLEVPRERWRELAAALGDRGVAGADPAAVVPQGATCVEVLVTVVP